MANDDIAPRAPSWPLRWTDTILDLQELLEDQPDGIWVVGGSVRDALLGRPIKDVDIATSGSGLRLARLIANRMNGDFYPLDDERDVGRALVETLSGQVVFDVAGLRGPDLLADLTDRDFTFNAMAVDMHGDLSQLIDPLGGEEDAIARVLRQCSPTSLQHDPLRTLRAVRQSAQLKARIDKTTLATIRMVAPRLREVSPERVRDEFMRLLSLPDVAAALRVADALGLLQLLMPETVGLRHARLTPEAPFDAWAQTLSSVEMLNALLATISPHRTDETAADFSLGMIVMALDRFRPQLQAHIDAAWADGRPHRALLMLAVLLSYAGGSGDSGVRTAEATAQALRLSNAERARLTTIIRHLPSPASLPDLAPVTLYRFWKAAGEAGVDICLLVLARYLGQSGPYLKQDDWIVFLERIRVLLDAWYMQREQWIDPPTLLDGNDLMETFALKAGPVVGRLLEQIREAQVSGEVVTREDALAFVQRALSNG